ncbi:MAG: AMP-binding protein [Candidatus Caldarchaeum sp.]
MRQYLDMLEHGSAWRIPKLFNAGSAVLQNEGSSTAIINVDEEGFVSVYSFNDMLRFSSMVANGLRENGVGRGDRVVLHLLQGCEFVGCLLAVYRLGAIAVTVPALLGSEAVEYRVKDSGAKAVIVDQALKHKLSNINTEQTKIFVANGEGGEKTQSLEELMGGLASFSDVETSSDEAAHIFYTSGTEGPPKGAVHAHRWILTHIPCFKLAYDNGPREDDVFWTPADWAWIGGCGNLLLTALLFGRPVVAVRRLGRFDPAKAYEVMEQFKITCSFIPPTALRIMRRFNPEPLKHYNLSLRAVLSGGEPVTAEIVEWGRKEMNASINETYGQTEANLLTANSAAAGILKPGSVGKPVPGHVIQILDEALRPLPAGVLGHIALKLPDPAAFLGYWRNPEATAMKMRDSCLLTGDLGWMDTDGYVWFKSRADDLIKTSGYRLSPWEVEQAINRHPAVEESAVIGVPDPERYQAVKAFIVLKQGFEPSTQLVEELCEAVRKAVGPHATPRDVEFVKEIPKTATFKLKRSELRKKLG